LRIAVWHNLPSGGGKRALYDQVKGLVEAGHEVQVFVPPTADESFLPLSDLAPVVQLHLTRHDLPKSLLGKVHALAVGPFRFVFAMMAHGQLLGAALKDFRPDVTLFGPCRTFFAPLPLLTVSKLGFKTCLYLQEPNRGLYEACPELIWIRKTSRIRRELDYARTFATLERQSAAAADRILVNSRFSRESVSRAYGLDSSVCYLGIDTDRFKPTGEPKEDFVIGVGAIVPAKRIELAIEACAIAGAKKLVWVGNSVDDKYRQQLEELAKAKGVHFDLRHLVSDEELVSLLSMAALMV